jgi:Domain of unknown function (DUF4440)
MSDSATAAALQQAFEQGLAVFQGKGTREAFFAFLADDVLVIDEDTPFVLDRAAFSDHIDFHLSGIWDSVAWMPRDTRIEVLGTSGVISGAFTFRGKPRDGGFRLRHGNFSLLCVLHSGVWRAMTFTLSPLQSHILDASPG